MQDNGWKVTSHALHYGCLGHAGRAGAAFAGAVAMADLRRQDGAPWPRVPMQRPGANVGRTARDVSLAEARFASDLCAGPSSFLRTRSLMKL